MTNPDPESISWLRFIIASVTVIALMGVLAWGLKFLAARGVVQAGKERRLRLIESLPLDARRRLVIVACDGTQHLLLLGANQDCVVAGKIPVPHQEPSTTQTGEVYSVLKDLSFRKIFFRRRAGSKL